MPDTDNTDDTINHNRENTARKDDAISTKTVKPMKNSTTTAAGEGGGPKDEKDEVQRALRIDTNNEQKTGKAMDECDYSFVYCIY
jgi:hypothetical protein